jgi:regulatory protein
MSDNKKTEEKYKETELKEAAFRVISIRPRSEFELKNLLYKKAGSSPAGRVLAGQVLKYLKDSGYLDDRKFIRWFFQARQGRNARGQQQILHELVTKGVDRQLISEVMRDPDITESEFDRAVRFIASCQKKWQRHQGKDRREKIRRLLLNRGFSFEIIARFIDVFDPKGYNTVTDSADSCA